MSKESTEKLDRIMRAIRVAYPEHEIRLEVKPVRDPGEPERAMLTVFANANTQLISKCEVTPSAALVAIEKWLRDLMSNKVQSAGAEQKRASDLAFAVSRELDG